MSALPLEWQEAVHELRLRAVPPRARSREQAIEMMDAGECLFCPRNGLKLLASHTFQIHGVTAQELRDLCQLPMTHGWVSEEESARRRELASTPGWIERLPRVSTAGRKLRLSPAKLRAQRENLALIPEDERRENARASMARLWSDPEWRARQQATQRRVQVDAAQRRWKPHPCSECGAIVRGGRKTCSDVCARARMSLGWRNVVAGR